MRESDLILTDAEVERGTFASSLSFQDRQRLRAVIKKIHFANYPTELCTDKEADKLISALGPQVGQQIIEKAMARGFVP